jgi:hypothetical protein
MTEAGFFISVRPRANGAKDISPGQRPGLAGAMEFGPP